jgi:cytochrome c oxidase cbb3-type subunit 3
MTRLCRFVEARPGMVGVVAIVLVMASACGGSTKSAAGDAASPPIATPVGPVPGPAAPLRDAANPFANDRKAMVDGRQLFVRFNCYGCHGGRAGGGMGPSLRDVDWIYGNRDAQLFSTIAEGRAHGMPAWAPRLTNEQIWQLVSYIKSLRTANEPQPPIQ